MFPSNANSTQRYSVTALGNLIV